jgi:predicted glutamine amidotransferase
MCQLLGMNCSAATDICFSLKGFHTRGGLTDHHRDGWGIAFFEGCGVRTFLDPRASVESPIADMVRNYPIHSTNVVAHIRRATRGRVALENTHPFTRELWGRYWVFAHNGTLHDFEPELSGRFRPVGGTDSELAFCYLLESLQRLFPDAHPAPSQLGAALRELARDIASYGEFNFLLSNGDALYAHCSPRLTYTVRRMPFAQYHLVDQDVTVDFSHLTAIDRVAVIATVPLTDNERWTTMGKGELLCFRHGEPEPV